MAENCSSSRIKHFVLVHGACHGAWCWYKLVLLLEKHGHKVTALDLAASGRNEERLQELKTMDDYHKPLYSFLEELPEEEKVIVVGHSMGGYAVSSAMEKFPHKIEWAVFVSAFMLGPDLTMDKLALKFAAPDFYMDSEVKIVEENGNAQTHMIFGNKFLEAKLYQKSPPEVAGWRVDGVIVGSAMVKVPGEAKSPEEGLKDLEAMESYFIVIKQCHKMHLSGLNSRELRP